MIINAAKHFYSILLTDFREEEFWSEEESWSEEYFGF